MQKFRYRLLFNIFFIFMKITIVNSLKSLNRYILKSFNFFLTFIFINIISIVNSNYFSFCNNTFIINQKIQLYIVVKSLFHFHKNNYSLFA